MTGASSSGVVPSWARAPSDGLAAPPRKRRTNASFTIATGGDSSRSRLVNVRPATSGIPSALK